MTLIIISASKGKLKSDNSGLEIAVWMRNRKTRHYATVAFGRMSCDNCDWPWKNICILYSQESSKILAMTV